MLIPQTKNIGLPLMNLMRFKGLPILQQLHIEEQLLRTSSENWCIVNDGTNDPTVVMGVLGRSGSCHKKGEVLLLLTMGRYLSLSYAIKKQFLTYNHILDQSCLGAAHYTAKSFKELVISIFVKMARSHLDFICRMKDYMPRSTFMDKTVEATETQFSLRPIQLEAIRTCLEAEFCPSSRFLTNEELEAAAVALQS